MCLRQPGTSTSHDSECASGRTVLASHHAPDPRAHLKASRAFCEHCAADGHPAQLSYDQLATHTVALPDGSYARLCDPCRELTLPGAARMTEHDARQTKGTRCDILA